MQNRTNITSQISNLCQIDMDNAAAVYEHLNNEGLIDYDAHAGLSINSTVTDNLIAHATVALAD